MGEPPWDKALQYSCLENPIDRGAWRATAHGVAKSRDMTESTQQPVVNLYAFLHIYCISIEKILMNIFYISLVFKLIFNWRITALQCSISFCHTAM